MITSSPELAALNSQSADAGLGPTVNRQLSAEPNPLMLSLPPGRVVGDSPMGDPAAYPIGVVIRVAWGHYRHLPA